METLRWVIGASVVALVAVIAVTRASPGQSAFPGASGKIAFQSDRDGNGEIYVMNADGGGQTRLTDNQAIDAGSAWSPDGSKIAFISTRDDPNPLTCLPACNAEVYAMNADGSGQTNLSNNAAFDSNPAWSPDGKKIAFDSNRAGNREIYVMNADGGEQTRLTENDARDLDPAWSPDGTKIAFDSERDGKFEVYVMNADGSGQTRLTQNDAVDVDPAWSPDGEKIAFYSNRDGNFEVYVMNPDGTGQTNLTNNPAVDAEPAWSADGGKIVFSSDREGNLEIYAMNAGGTGQTRLTNNDAYDDEPDWQPLGGLRGDVNCDGTVDSVDALFILRHVAHLPVTLPPGCPEIGT